MFYVGQKVVFIGGGAARTIFGETVPQAGEVYTIRDISFGENGTYLRLEEIVNSLHYYIEGLSEARFNAFYFRPVVTTDISIFEAMLVPTPKEKVEA